METDLGQGWAGIGGLAAILRAGVLLFRLSRRFSRGGIAEPRGISISGWSLMDVSYAKWILNTGTCRTLILGRLSGLSINFPLQDGVIKLKAFGNGT